ncbi:serine protease inhibitor Cvsi-1-like [Saccostrea echinata]|uniref:serine protease inhibitor Cvsi-1-like n=1 Tax=Saccostrea echinata TaxID=191078 RepID=UPI002A802AFA|nr:serine protease inhibitor Cvsi-1-like [Saccostrea echinata]
MKVLVSITVFGLLAAFISGERCQGADDCTLETCASGSFIGCTQGICTCLTERRCRGLRDCYGLPACADQNASWHCFDNVCKCIDI